MSKSLLRLGLPLYISCTTETVSGRPCDDYRRLNQRTLPDKYPILFFTDCIAKLADCSMFNKTDFIRGLFQIPVHPDSIPKPAIVARFGAIKFLRMSFVLRNAAQTFIKEMDKALHGLDFIFVCLDDILVFSRSNSDYELHLPKVLQCFKDFGLITRKNKCAFVQPSVEFLGHTLMHMTFARSRDFLESQTVKQAQAFAGLVNINILYLTQHPLCLPSTKSSEQRQDV